MLQIYIGHIREYTKALENRDNKGKGKGGLGGCAKC